MDPAWGEGLADDAAQPAMALAFVHEQITFEKIEKIRLIAVEPSNQADGAYIGTI